MPLFSATADTVIIVPVFVKVSGVVDFSIDSVDFVVVVVVVVVDGFSVVVVIVLVIVVLVVVVVVVLVVDVVVFFIGLVLVEVSKWDVVM